MKQSNSPELLNLLFEHMFYKNNKNAKGMPKLILPRKTAGHSGYRPNNHKLWLSRMPGLGFWTPTWAPGWRGAETRHPVSEAKLGFLESQAGESHELAGKCN